MRLLLSAGEIELSRENCLTPSHPQPSALIRGTSGQVSELVHLLTSPNLIRQGNLPSTISRSDNCCPTSRFRGDMENPSQSRITRHLSLDVAGLHSPGPSSHYCNWKAFCRLSVTCGHNQPTKLAGTHTHLGTHTLGSAGPH